MLDIVLMVVFGLRLSKRCKRAGIPSFKHVFKLIAYWLGCEFLGIALMMQLTSNLYLIALCSILLGWTAAFLSYRKSIGEIQSFHDGDVPRLPL